MSTGVFDDLSKVDTKTGLTKAQSEFIKKYLPKVPLTFGRKDALSGKKQVLEGFKEFLNLRNELKGRMEKEVPQDNVHRQEIEAKFRLADVEVQGKKVKGEENQLDLDAGNRRLNEARELINLVKRERPLACRALRWNARGRASVSHRLPGPVSPATRLNGGTWNSAGVNLAWHFRKF